MVPECLGMIPDSDALDSMFIPGSLIDQYGNRLDSDGHKAKIGTGTFTGCTQRNKSSECVKVMNTSLFGF